jgi:nucleotide-binding universal stress UspA family protein
MTVVCGTTLGDECRATAEVAARLAARLGERLRLVHVSEDLRAPVVLGTSEESAVLGQVRAALEAEGQRLAGLAGIVVDVHLAAGPVADGLVAVADFEQASVLVVGPGATARPPRVGIVVELILRRASVPVLVVKQPDRLRDWLERRAPLGVLVGADPGRSARAARNAIEGWRRAGDIVVTTASVVPPGTPVREHRARLVQAGHADDALEVIVDNAAPEVRLADLAGTRHSSLVVVGQRPRSVLERVWSGSVSRGIIETVGQNVLCVPAGVSVAPAPARAPDVVLVGVDVDDPESGRRALEAGLALVRPGGRLHVVTAVDEADRERRRGRRERAWAGLERLVQQAGAGDCERHVVDGEVVAGLLQVAARVDAAVVVVSGRRRSLVSRALVGSVARGLVDAATVPVVVVPAEPA